MKLRNLSLIILIVNLLVNLNLSAQIKSAQNPVIYADVPDLSMIRVGDTYCLLPPS